MVRKLEELVINKSILTDFVKSYLLKKKNLLSIIQKFKVFYTIKTY